MKQGEINISFINGTFNMNLKEGESIDLRLKNDDGYIYVGKVDEDLGMTNKEKQTGYSSVGLEDKNKKIDLSDDELQSSHSNETSAIYDILNEKSPTTDIESDNNNTKPKSQNVSDESTLESSVDKKTIVTNDSEKDSEPKDNNDLSSTTQFPQTESKQTKDEDNITRRYMPIEDDEDE